MSFTPRPHQILFSKAEERYVGLFGGVGNGKTRIACRKILSKATQFSNNLLLVGRLTYPELRDSTRETFLSEMISHYPKEAYAFNKSENSVTLWNKSAVIFRHLDDHRGLLGPNLGGFYIDQAEEVDENIFLTLQSRLRRPNVGNLQGYITGNPNGHNWVYYKFGINHSNGERDWCYNKDYRMITASSHSNAANLPSDYIEQLKRSYSPEWFDRYVNGSWDVFEGQPWDLSKVQSYSTLPKMLMVLTACDPAISKENHACNTAFCTLGMGEDGYVYDIESIAGKWSFLETLDQARMVIMRNKPRYLGVESVGYQKALYESCQRSFPMIEVLALGADKDKIRRAKTVSHIIDQGLFRTNNQDLLDEMSAFTPHASSRKKNKEKKDRVDALVHALHMIQKYAPVPRQKVPAATASLPYQEWFLHKSIQQMDQVEGSSDDEIFDDSYQPEAGYY